MLNDVCGGESDDNTATEMIKVIKVCNRWSMILVVLCTGILVNVVVVYRS